MIMVLDSYQFRHFSAILIARLEKTHCVLTVNDNHYYDDYDFLYYDSELQHI